MGGIVVVLEHPYIKKGALPISPPEKPVVEIKETKKVHSKVLTTEAVQTASLPLQSVDHVHGGGGLALGVLGVGGSITDDVLQENPEDTSDLFVDETGDTLHTTTASETADIGLGDALDVVAQDHAWPVETFDSLPTSRHAPCQNRPPSTCILRFSGCAWPRSTVRSRCSRMRTSA